jgi:hypothetical protein
MKSTRYLMGFVLVISLFLACWPAHADGPVVGVNAGLNATSFDGAQALPSDFEAGGTASMSLSPHLSVVGSGWYGLGRDYVRGTGGARVTSSDVSNTNFNTFFGLEYQGSTKESVRPREWVPVAGFGLRPWPQKWPRIIVTGEGGYGLTSKQAHAYLGLRYHPNAP